MRKIENAIHPEDPKHFDLLGLKQTVVEPWEDGMRTNGADGTYEWWYADAHFADGSSLVVGFYTKSCISLAGSMAPFIKISLTTADGTVYTEQVGPDGILPKDYHFAKDRCECRIKDNYFAGDLHQYTICVNGEKLQAKMTLQGRIRPWRPQSGQILFGDHEESVFAWLPAVPEAEAVADITGQAGTLHLIGTGYHDHNWGNVPMQKVMHHWYWGRAKIGRYSVISVWITAEKKYGYKDFDIFMLAKDGVIIGDNSNHKLRFLPENPYLDEVTGKTVYNSVIYEYETAEGELYRITYKREGDIERTPLAGSLKGIKKLVANLIRFDGAYQRFCGEATVERIENGKVVEIATESSAVWELMYFGNNLNASERA